MTNQAICFNDNIAILSNLGYDRNGSLSIIKRINQHLQYCIDNNQNYSETLFFVEQDFSFPASTIEMLVVNCMIVEPSFEEYFSQNM